MKDTERLLREKYGGTPSTEYEADCARLETGEPLAYVIGWAPFLDCRIHFDSHPLIPRPETEFWTEQALEEMKYKESVSVLDLFAGSGAIGVAVLKHITNARVDFGEIDESLFATIQKNIHENAPTQKEGVNPVRARILQTNVWSGISDRYDFILANPPYVSENLTDRIQKSVLDFEPHTALFAENEGFSLIEETIRGASRHLNSSGVLYIEHEPEHKEQLIATAREAGLGLELMKDQFGTYRYSVLRAVA